MERSALHRKLKSLGVVTSAKAGARTAHVEAPSQAAE
jgi:two-component system nitrogen regulation response regulator NtrX